MTRTIAAGFAAVDVTPAIPVALSGFAAREGPAVAVHDALFARAMALDDGARRVVVVALDVIGVEASFVGALRRRLAATGRVDQDAVFVAATHTHGGPAVLAEAFLGPVDPAVLARIEDGAVEAALQALAAMEIGRGRGGARP